MASRGLSKGALTATAAALAAFALLTHLSREAPPIPDPTTEAMEPQVGDAIRAARKEVFETVDSSEAWGKLGMVLHAHYLEAEAAACYQEARRLDDRDFRWPYLLARVLKSNDRERARLTLGEASRLKPDFAPIHILAGELEEEEGDIAGATASYRRALSVDRGSAAAEFGLGRLALAEGDLEASLQHLERAAELAPESGSVQAMLARVYRRIGQEDRAKEAARRAAALHPDVEVDDPILAAVTEHAVSLVGYQTRALNAERSGDPSRAEALLRRTVELRPGDANLHYNLANHLARQGRSNEAEESYRKALQLDEGHVPTLVNLGVLAAQKGERESATRFFEKAIEREPDHAGALLGLGNVAFAQGRLEEAIRLFERSVESDRDRPDSHYALALALAHRGSLDRAIEHNLAALDGAPEKADIHLYLAELYRKRQDYHAAETHLRLARDKGLEHSPGLASTNPAAKSK